MDLVSAEGSIVAHSWPLIVPLCVRRDKCLPGVPEDTSLECGALSIPSVLTKTLPAKITTWMGRRILMCEFRPQTTAGALGIPYPGQAVQYSQDNFSDVRNFAVT